MKPPKGPKKQTQNKPNFKPDDGFSAHYTRDCHGAEFTLSAAEGGLAMTFWELSCKEQLPGRRKTLAL